MKRRLIGVAVAAALSISLFTGVARADAGMAASNEMAPVTVAFADEAVPVVQYQVALGEVQVAAAAGSPRGRSASANPGPWSFGKWACRFGMAGLAAAGGSFILRSAGAVAAGEAVGTASAVAEEVFLGAKICPAK